MRTIYILGFLFLVSCSQETISTSYQGEKDQQVISSYNLQVAQSQVGFSKSYRTSNAQKRPMDSAFYDAQQLFSNYKPTEWLELSDAIKERLDIMAMKNLNTEVQILSLMTLDRHLLKVSDLQNANDEAAYYEALQYYLKALIRFESNDLDILASTLIRVKEYGMSNFIEDSKTYILETAKKDRDTANAQMKDMEGKPDQNGFDAVSKRHFEQVLMEAEYAIAEMEKI